MHLSFNIPLSTPLTQANAAEALRIVIVGHVDHGKSSLIGRLLHDTGSLPDGKLAAIEAACAKRGMPFEFAFLLDALQAERDQGVTIETSQIRLRSADRDIVIIDAPGHREFLKNMVTGAAQSDAAVLVIDAVEGMREQSRRHAYLLSLLGIGQIVVAVNKMDLVGYDRSRFEAVAQDCRSYLARIGVAHERFVPISARGGDNVVHRSAAMPWYAGPTVMDALGAFQPETPASELPLRLPVQDIYKFDNRRIIVGRVETGVLAVGDTLLFSPSNKTARVKSVEVWRGEAPITVRTGQSVGITLDDQIFVERGDLISHCDRPPIESDVFRARVFWLAHEPLRLGATCRIRLNATEAIVQVQAIERLVDTTDLAATTQAQEVGHNHVAEVVLRSRRMLAFDTYGASPLTGRFVLLERYDIAGGGVIGMEGYADQRRLVTPRVTNIQRVELRVTSEERSRRNGHHGGVIWLTGYSGAGKSTLAVELERRLHRKGYNVFVLDGDNVRHGLCADLGFSPEERAENIRRVGEVAALFSQAGMLVVTAFISPYRSDRERARQAANGVFHEVHVNAGLDACERRDPKGLYRKARKGEIREFTGISAPYEEPENPELVVDTESNSIEDCIEAMARYIDRHFGLTRTQLDQEELARQG